MKTVTLNHTDCGQIVEEEVHGVCHKATPKIFCTCMGMRLLYIDCGNTGWNPIEYVKINGEFGLLTRHSNHPSDDPVTWWFMRDPSRNYEFSFHHSTGPSDTNKIFLWWDDLDNLPEVEYGQAKDRGLQMFNCRDVQLKLTTSSVGVGLYMHNCHDNEITINCKDAGKALHMQRCNYNHIPRLDMRDIGHIGLHPDSGSHDNLFDVVSFWHAGICESSGAVWITGADEDGPTRNNRIRFLHGGKARYARFWPLDGAGVMFEQGVRDNVIDMASLAQCFTAVQENSGMPGNRIHRLVAMQCVNTLDQSDSSLHGQADPLNIFAPDIYCLGSGPFGMRTPNIGHATVIGEHAPHKSRTEYPFYPDLPGWEDFKIQDAMKLEGEIPWWWAED